MTVRDLIKELNNIGNEDLEILINVSSSGLQGISFIDQVRLFTDDKEDCVLINGHEY